MTRKIFGRFTFAVAVLALVLLSACGKEDATNGAPVQASAEDVRACSDGFKMFGRDGDAYCQCTLSWDASVKKGLASREQNTQAQRECAEKFSPFR